MKMSGRFKLSAIIAGVLIENIVFAADCWRFPTDKITAEQWQTYFNEVRALPGAQVSENLAPDQVNVSVNKNAVYIFTAPTHPAYPAVVIRQLVVDDKGDVRIERRGHYAGDKAAYDLWWHEFDELDRHFRERVQKRLSK